MSLPGMLSSASQRFHFTVISCLVVLSLFLFALLVYLVAPDTRGWNLLLNVVLAILSSTIFAIVTAFFIRYFFDDPFEMSAANRLLPKDIGPALKDMAEDALTYRLLVRTGRHFRADVLPILVRNATRRRSPMRIEVVLLDFRDQDVCERYASYRRSSSFDGKDWDVTYVKKEVLATILKLIEATHNHRQFITFHLYLSKRLSTFRIDGSHDQVIVTREDPRDVAFLYRKSDADFSAYSTEFIWTQEGASKEMACPTADTPIEALYAMFESSKEISELAEDVIASTNEPSPYVR